MMNTRGEMRDKLTIDGSHKEAQEEHSLLLCDTTLRRYTCAMTKEYCHSRGWKCVTLVSRFATWRMSYLQIYAHLINEGGRRLFVREQETNGGQLWCYRSQLTQSRGNGR
jgi:hypothetical protein